MPSQEHEDAVSAIVEFIAAEFNISVGEIDITGDFFPMRLRPDISFIKPGTDKYVVVEVGDTNAEKINQYRKSNIVCEIRWYTKRSKGNGIYLVGQWDMALAPVVKINRKSYRIKMMEKELRSKAEVFQSELQALHITLDSVVACPECGRQLPIRALLPADHRGKYYGICSKCNSPAEEEVA